MPFCQNCGAQLDPSARFCLYCGSPAGTVQAPQQMPQQQMQQPAQSRQESLAELAKMMGYFGQKQMQYDEYDAVNYKMSKLLRGTSVAPLVWGIIIAIFDSILIFSFVTQGNFKGGIIPFFLFFLIPAVFLITYYIVCTTRRSRELNRCYDRLAELANELTAHYAGYGYCIVGAEYTNPAILNRMAAVIQSGRADTPRDAVNVMLLDSHRSPMDFQAQMTTIASRQAARGAVNAAVFSAAAFFI